MRLKDLKTSRIMKASGEKSKHDDYACQRQVKRAFDLCFENNKEGLKLLAKL